MPVSKSLGIRGFTGDVAGLRGLKFKLPDLVLIISEKFCLLEFLFKKSFLFFPSLKGYEYLSKILKFYCNRNSNFLPALPDKAKQV